MGSNHLTTGELGEKAAADFLATNGYKIIATRYRCKIGEIDIIAWQGSTLVFVEVKTRRGYGYGAPGEAVGRAKQAKIIRTAQFYLRGKGLDDCRFRFDVTEIVVLGDKVSINHITNAFGG